MIVLFYYFCACALTSHKSLHKQM